MFCWFRFPPPLTRKTVTEVATLSMARAKTRPTRTAVSIQQSASSSARLHSSLFIGAARRWEEVVRWFQPDSFRMHREPDEEIDDVYFCPPQTHMVLIRNISVCLKWLSGEEICLCAAAIRSFWVGNVILFYFTSNAKWQIHGRTTRPSVPS